MLPVPVRVTVPQTFPLRFALAPLMSATMPEPWIVSVPFPRCPVTLPPSDCAHIAAALSTIRPCHEAVSPSRRPGMAPTTTPSGHIRPARHEQGLPGDVFARVAAQVQDRPRDVLGLRD